MCLRKASQSVDRLIGPRGPRLTFAVGARVIRRVAVLRRWRVEHGCHGQLLLGRRSMLVHRGWGIGARPSPTPFSSSSQLFRRQLIGFGVGFERRHGGSKPRSRWGALTSSWEVGGESWELGLRDRGKLRAAVESLEVVECRQAGRRQGSASQIDSAARLNMAPQSYRDSIRGAQSRGEGKDGVVRSRKEDAGESGQSTVTEELSQ